MARVMEIANVLLRDGAQEGVVSGVKILIKEFRNNSVAGQGLSHLQVMGEANHEQQSRLRYLRYVCYLVALFPSFAFLCRETCIAVGQSHSQTGRTPHGSSHRRKQK